MRLRSCLAALALFAAPVWAKNVGAGSPGIDPPSICDAIAGNLVTNCGFETGDFTGWTLGGNTGFTGVGTFGTTSVSVNSGSFYAYLGAVGSDDILSQTIATTIGQTYEVSFYLASDGGTPNDFTAKFNGDTGYSVTNLPSQGYVQEQFFVTATAGSTVLEFDSRNDPGYLGLDDISVVATSATPEPRFYGVLLGLLAAGAIMIKRRKVATL